MNHPVLHRALLRAGALLPLVVGACANADGIPPSADQQQALVDLGSRLMFDERLSRPQGVACGTCHDPNLGWGDARPQGKGVQDNTLAAPTGTTPHDGLLAVAGARYKTLLTGRNTPTVYNSHVFPNLFWDGRAAGLAHQANFPIGGSVEMNSDWETHVIPYLAADADYPAMFEAAFGVAGITQLKAVAAIGAFEETISVFDTPYDRYVAGETDALSAQEVAGMDLFFGAAGCAECHPAPLLTDLSFHNLGVPDAGTVALNGGTDIGKGAGDDLTAAPAGPMVSNPNPADDYKFKTPQLRMAAVTGPYFHNGSMATIEDVVEFVTTGGGTDLSAGLTKDPAIIDLGLTAQQKADLVAFVKNGLLGEEIK